MSKSMAIEGLLILLTLSIAVIGIFTSKDLPRKVVVILLFLYLAIACFGIYREWISEKSISEEKAKEAAAGKLSTITKVHYRNGEPCIYIEFGNQGTINIVPFNPRESTYRLFQGLRGLEWIPIWFKLHGDRLIVSATIFDEEGKVVAIIVDNEWQINPGNAFDRNYTDDALEIINSSNEVTFQIVLLEDKVQVQARLYDNKGRKLTICNSPTGKGAYFGAIDPDILPEEHYPIRRIFKYPSAHHLGERLDR